MTQTSGKTGLGGAGRKRSSRGPAGSGGGGARWLIPLLRKWRPRAWGGGKPSGVPICHHQEWQAKWSWRGLQDAGGGWGCQLDLPRGETLFPNLALVPPDPRESQGSELITFRHRGAPLWRVRGRAHPLSSSNLPRGVGAKGKDSFRR